MPNVIFIMSDDHAAHAISAYGSRVNTTPHMDRLAASESIKNNRDTHILLTFGEGDESIRFWSTDLTAEYVRLNADYHT